MGKGKDEPRGLAAPVLHLSCASVSPVSRAEHRDGAFLGVPESPSSLGEGGSGQVSQTQQCPLELNYRRGDVAKSTSCHGNTNEIF